MSNIIKCDWCGKYYNTSKVDRCPNCGGFNNHLIIPEDEKQKEKEFKQKQLEQIQKENSKTKSRIFTFLITLFTLFFGMPIILIIIFGCLFFSKIPPENSANNQNYEYSTSIDLENYDDYN